MRARNVQGEAGDDDGREAPSQPKPNRSRTKGCIYVGMIALFAFSRLCRFLFPRRDLAADVDVSSASSFRPKTSAADADADADAAAVAPPSSGTTWPGRRYTNPLVLSKGCSVTVVMMEPAIKSRAHVSLESVAANIRPVETACFLIQTSACRIRDEMMSMTTTAKNATPATATARANEGGAEGGGGGGGEADGSSTAEESGGGGGGESVTEDAVYEELLRRIESEALPNFRRMIRNGQVRVTITDSDKYGFRACDNFYSPSNAWLDYRYWGPDEFAAEDPDAVLIVQSDVVLCHPLHAPSWRSFAWVAPPWPPKRAGQPGICMCEHMPKTWASFHSGHRGGTNNGQAAVPAFPSEEEICSDSTLAPIGNGGYSLRSRSWMRRAIAYCPSKYAHLPDEIRDDGRNSTGCRVGGKAVFEDMILSAILRGLGAPFPDAYEASLFGADMRFPDDNEKNYYNYTDSSADLESMAQKRWYASNETALERYRRMRAKQVSSSAANPTPIVPIGLHKIWRYHRWIKKSNYLQEECPYLFELMQQL